MAHRLGGRFPDADRERFSAQPGGGPGGETGAAQSPGRQGGRRGGEHPGRRRDRQCGGGGAGIACGRAARAAPVAASALAADQGGEQSVARMEHTRAFTPVFAGYAKCGNGGPGLRKRSIRATESYPSEGRPVVTPFHSTATCSPCSHHFPKLFLALLSMTSNSGLAASVQRDRKSTRL